MEDNLVLQNSGADKPEEFNIEKWISIADPVAKKKYQDSTNTKKLYTNDPKKVVEPRTIEVDGVVPVKKPIAPPLAPPMPSPVLTAPPMPVDPVVELAHEVIEEGSPVPEMQEEEYVPPQATPQAPASVEKEKGMSGMDWLVGATPLLVDFLQGGSSGTSISADYFTKKGTGETAKEKIALAIEKMKLQREQEKTRRTMAGQLDGNGKPLTKSNGSWVQDSTGKQRWATFDEIRVNPSLTPGAGGDELLEGKQIGDYYAPNAPGVVIKSTHSDAISKGLLPYVRGREVDANTQANIASREKIAALKNKLDREKRVADINNMNFDNQNSLLKSRESDPVTRGTREISTNFASAQKAGRRWAADPATRAITEQELVVKYLKMLDPTSVARESEQLGVVNAKGAYDIISTFPNRLKLGQQLTGAQVKGILNSAKVRMQEQLKAQGELDSAYGSRGKRFGWDISYGLKVPSVQYDTYDYLDKITNGGKTDRPVKGTASYEKEYEEWKKKKGY